MDSPSPGVDASVALAFLRTLFPQPTPDHFVLIWTNPGKRSNWIKIHHNNTDRATVRALLDGNRHRNVYIGAGLSETDNGPTRRVRKALVAGIPGFWADIDVSGPGHKESRKPLPESFDKAMELLDRHAPQPTLLVNSGGGLQAWWLFDRPWIFKGPDERELAQAQAKAFNDHLRARFDEDGYDLDATWDLSRVMRLPGSLNVKTTPRLVEVIDDTALRYASGAELLKTAGVDLSEAPQAASTEKTKTKQLAAETLEQYPGVDMSMATFLFEVDKQAERAWKGDACPWLSDQSDSARDLSIATRCAQGGWSRTEIIALLIAGRKHRNSDLKRPDYYERTVDAAFRHQAGSEADRQAIELSIGAADDGPEVEPSKPTLLAALNKQIGLGEEAISEIRKITGSPETFTLTLSGVGTVSVGDVGGLLDQNRFRKAIAGQLGKVVKRRKADVWDGLVQIMLNLAVTVDGGRERSDHTLIVDSLDDYISIELDTDPETRGEWQERAAMNMPFEHDGELHISTNGTGGFISWLGSNRYFKVDQKQVAGILRQEGWDHRRLQFKYDRRNTTRNVWVRSRNAVTP